MAVRGDPIERNMDFSSVRRRGSQITGEALLGYGDDLVVEARQMIAQGAGRTRRSGNSG
jgi:hypothetical protein